jgi:hypothetical protein
VVLALAVCLGAALALQRMSRDVYLNVITEHNKAQFALQRALGGE